MSNQSLRPIHWPKLRKLTSALRTARLGSAPCSQCNRQSEQSPPVSSGSRATRKLSYIQPRGVSRLLGDEAGLGSINGDGYFIPLDPFPQILAPCRLLVTYRSREMVFYRRTSRPGIVTRKGYYLLSLG